MKVVSLVVRGSVCVVFIGCIKLLCKGDGYAAVEKGGKKLGPGLALYWSNSRLCLISLSVWLLLFACFPDSFTLKMVTVMFDKCQEILTPLHSPIPKASPT